MKPDLFRIHLKARELAERALVCEFTNPTDRTKAERLIAVEMAVVDLLKELGAEKTK